MKHATARSEGARGATIMEYSLVILVIGLIIVFMASHLGGVLRARYGASKATVDMTKVDPNRHVEVEDHGLTGTARSVPNE